MHVTHMYTYIIRREGQSEKRRSWRAGWQACRRRLPTNRPWRSRGGRTGLWRSWAWRPTRRSMSARGTCGRSWRGRTGWGWTPSGRRSGRSRRHRLWISWRRAGSSTSASTSRASGGTKEKVHQFVPTPKHSPEVQSLSPADSCSSPFSVLVFPCRNMASKGCVWVLKSFASPVAYVLTVWHVNNRSVAAGCSRGMSSGLTHRKQLGKRRFYSDHRIKAQWGLLKPSAYSYFSISVQITALPLDLKN